MGDGAIVGVSVIGMVGVDVSGSGVVVIVGGSEVIAVEYVTTGTMVDAVVVCGIGFRGWTQPAKNKHRSITAL